MNLAWLPSSLNTSGGRLSKCRNKGLLRSCRTRILAATTKSFDVSILSHLPFLTSKKSLPHYVFLHSQLLLLILREREAELRLAGQVNFTLVNSYPLGQT